MNARGVRSVEGRVCIMLDVLRASSTMLAMFEAGARELRLAATPEAALAVAAAPLVLVGSPRNEVAVVRLARREALARGCDLLILCAGDQAGYGISLEDAFVAGMLVERLVKLSPQRVTPDQSADQPEALALDDSAIVAHRLFRSYLGPQAPHATSETVQTMFGESRSGRSLPGNGFGADLDYCAEIDVTTVVPRLDARGDVLTVVANGPGDLGDSE